jgi:hypothetical protein
LPTRAGDGTENSETKKPPKSAEELMEACPPKLRAHLHDFAKQERDRWVQSALQALAMVERVQFIKKSAEENGGATKIAPVDNENSGIIEGNTQYEAALHQLIQILHGLEIDPLTLQSAYKNNISFLLDCSRVTSITGTAGSQPERSFVERLFNMMTVEVPRYKKWLFERHPDHVCVDRNQWMERVCEQVSACI